MAFTINKTDGTLLTTIADGTTDTTTDITLIGKNYAGYGEVLNENQVSLLENFANTTANSPTSPLTGQLFFDTTDAQLKVYSGTAFKTVAQSIVSTSHWHCMDIDRSSSNCWSRNHRINHHNYYRHHRHR
mgnify:CR=1 FL=1